MRGKLDYTKSRAVRARPFCAARDTVRRVRRRPASVHRHTFAMMEAVLILPTIAQRLC